MILQLHHAAGRLNHSPQAEEAASRKKEPIPGPAASGPKKARQTRETPIRNKVLLRPKTLSFFMRQAGKSIFPLSRSMAAKRQAIGNPNQADGQQHHQRPEKKREKAQLFLVKSGFAFHPQNFNPVWANWPNTGFIHQIAPAQMANRMKNKTISNLVGSVCAPACQLGLRLFSGGFFDYSSCGFQAFHFTRNSKF